MRAILAVFAALVIVMTMTQPLAAQSTTPAPLTPPARILFAGNSLTYGRIHAEWPGGWGMAATQPDKDYVHRTQLLIAAATGQVPDIAVASLDLNRDEYFAEAQSKASEFHADIAVIQMGDQAWALQEEDYKNRLRMVAGWFSPARLVITGSWYQATCERWNRDVAKYSSRLRSNDATSISGIWPVAAVMCSCVLCT